MKTLPEIISTGAVQHPTRTAFKSGTHTLSYEELRKQMSQLSGYLQRQGLGKGDRVGVLMNRSLESVPAVYGIMHAGGAFVPLDPQLPLSRIEQIITTCGINIVVTTPRQSKILNSLKAKVRLSHIIGLDDTSLPWKTISWDGILELEGSKSDPSIDADDLAYIMFTSGSTGLPKGIMHTHRSGLSYARLSAALYDLDSEDVIGNVAPLHFDQSTFGYFSSPYAGSSTIIISDGHLALPGSMAQLIKIEGLTVLYSVPLIFIQLLDANLVQEFPKLRWILYGGEPFPPGKLNQLMEKLPNVRFSNVYGPAEVNQCTFYNMKGSIDPEHSVPLGKAWQETDILVVDEDNVPVEQHQVGELLVRSSTMMKGYWKNPALTKKSLYHTKKDARPYYRTGDLVRVNQNGDLIFVGRKDRQVKVRGYRIELTEVENAINMYEGVLEAAVFTTRDQNNRELRAAVVMQPDRELVEEDIIHWLASQLPRYSIPSFIITMNSLPRSVNGKVDYKRLESDSTTKSIKN